ncbi:MAG: transposase [Negativicutes bacterium]
MTPIKSDSPSCLLHDRRRTTQHVCQEAGTVKRVDGLISKANSGLFLTHEQSSARTYCRLAHFFGYKDKTDGQEKTETVSVEEFIGRLVQHIPAENFKLIRHYGIYARRVRSLCRKILGRWQERMKSTRAATIFL